MVKKFIDKKSAKTFQLVYRAQDDPLAFEDGSKGRVFVPTQRGAITTGAKGKETAAIGSQAVQRGLEHMRLNEEDGAEDYDDALDAGGAGMAALYGIYLDDREYDYTKHLRQIGASGGSGGGVILEAPGRKEKQSGGGIQILDPTAQQQQSAMTHHRMDIRSEAVPTGLQPHMDPRVRDVLEALDDADAEEPEDEDDFFEKLNADELEPESGDEDNDGDDYGDDGDDDAAFDPNDVFAAIQRMKARHHQSQPQRDSDSDTDDDSRDGWARTASTAGTSMSSSAMFRNERLTLLDEQFDAIEAMYEKNDSDDDSDGGERYDADGNFIVEYGADGNPKPLSTRPDFDNVMRDFLDSYELTGKKMQTKVEGTTGAGKLSTYRHAMLDDTATGAENRRRLLAVGTRQIEETNAKTKEMDDAEIDELFKGPERTPWDCQSVLSTYSNLDNHPAVIYEERKPQIRVSRKSGFPVVATSTAEKQSKDDRDDSGDDAREKENKGAARVKGETADEKRERKRRLQEAKRERREQKKDTREAFAEKRDRRMQSKKDRAQLAVHID
ncbi:Protein ltv1 [Coemansia sp. RSA 1200]|nr:Protein ltv1 [Coemansia sp. RSA 1200]